LAKNIAAGKANAAADPSKAQDFNLNSVSNQAITLMILGAFPWFVASKAYQDWCESELGANMSYEGREDRLDELFSFREGATEETVTRAIASVDTKEIDRLLAYGSWLDSLLAAVEDLPICVSLSTANVNRKGFPLIYVNKAFESTTGYMRSEIVGQNCRFLQSGGFCEQEVINKLTSALASASPIKVAITNYRKDGATFKNLLAMKPIFDTKGTYRFVIGVQFDVTAEDADISRINMIDDLLSILPNVVFCEDEV
jgi:PAS domain S-box-containing protein